MSVAIRFERLIPSAISESPAFSNRTRTAEAPDRGVQGVEAPETHHRSSEAPDAGHGRPSDTENHFTHGRSQS